jgi:FkbM family methyltransferase
MPSTSKSRRFDALEVCLVAILTATIAGATTARGVAVLLAKRYSRLSYVAYTAAQEQLSLKIRYGPARYSRNEEEWVIRDYFQDRREGTFVDVGANHYKNDSNTFYLESVLGWSGIAIDPQTMFAADYRTHRPRTRFFAFFVSDVTDATVALHLVDGNSLVASADQRFAELAAAEGEGPDRATRVVSVPTIRLSDLLDRVSITGFDLLSVDVELAEPKVLAGFEIDRFKPALVCVEGQPEVRQQILDYFAANSYVLVGKYLRADLQNLYFAPAHPAPTAGGALRAGTPENTPRR